MSIPLKTLSTSTATAQDGGISDTHSRTPSIQEVIPPVIDASISPATAARRRWQAQVPLEMQHRLDEAMNTVAELINELSDVRAHLNEVNDQLHTTMLRLRRVHKLVGRDL
jgi:hypothetical protein